MKKISALVAICAVVLAACGGGGGDKGSNPFPGPGGTGGGTGGGTAVASDISLSLSSTTVANSGSATVTATVTAVDVNRNTVQGIPVTLQVDNGATVSVSGTTTDSNGRVTGTVGIGSNQSNRVITVTATSAALVRQATVQVIGTKIVATALPTVIAPAATGKVQYKVTDSTSAPLPNFDITIAGVGGVTTPAKTDVNGSYEYSYTAPAAAGNLDIRASAGGVENVTTIVVQSGPGAIPPVTVGSVRSASVSANPSVITVNTTGTDNRAEVRALFVGNSNQAIRNVRVRFDLDSDANSIGGTFTSGTTIIYSDANGIAATSYVPGSRFSPTNGLTVRACWDYADFAAGTCPNSATATLTVISDALSVTLGTDGKLDVSEPLVYTQRFVVQVNDSSGLAKSDVQISPLLDLTTYSQGFWFRASDTWVQTVTASGCGNEDINRNGVLEEFSATAKEDANGNGQLDPRKADAVVSFDGASRTGTTGRVVLKMTYPRNVGSWVTYKLTVAATGVSGTEGRSSFAGTLAVPIDDVKAEPAPAFRFSPYGQTDGGGLPRPVVSTLDGRFSAALCTR